MTSTKQNAKAELPLPVLGDMACPRCGKNMKSGFVLGHIVPPRWAEVLGGRTIYYGVPLLKPVSAGRKLPPAEYLSLPARRCHGCHIGVFAFDNDAAEDPLRDSLVVWLAALVFSLLFAALIGIVSFVEWWRTAALWQLLRVGIIMLLVAIALVAAIRVVKIRGNRTRNAA